MTRDGTFHGVDLALFSFLGAVRLVDDDACAIGYRDIVAGTWRFE